MWDSMGYYGKSRNLVGIRLTEVVIPGWNGLPVRLAGGTASNLRGSAEARYNLGPRGLHPWQIKQAPGPRLDRPTIRPDRDEWDMVQGPWHRSSAEGESAPRSAWRPSSPSRLRGSPRATRLRPSP